MKRNKQFDDLLAKVPEETKRLVEKQKKEHWKHILKCGMRRKIVTLTMMVDVASLRVMNRLRKTSAGIV